MATHNVKVLFSGTKSQSNPDQVPISIFGQVQNLKLVKFDELQSKFGDFVNQQVISLKYKLWKKFSNLPKKIDTFAHKVSGSNPG